MEKQFAELLEQVRAEFPEYDVTMGIARYESDIEPFWWIVLKEVDSKCECCGATKSPYHTYNNPTFAAAIADIRAKVPR